MTIALMMNRPMRIDKMKKSFCLILFILLPCLWQAIWSLEPTYFKGRKLDIPRREHAVIIGNEGFYPQDISLFEGESLKLYITNTTDKPGCFFLPEKELFLSVDKGEIAEGHVIFSKPGQYRFYCPTGTMSGRITVLDRVTEEERIGRSLASEEGTVKVKVWRPREE